MRMLREMAQPLLQLFLGDGSSSNSSKTTRRQVGHCLAVLCLSYSVLGGSVDDATAANEVMAQVLTGIGPGVRFSFRFIFVLGLDLRFIASHCVPDWQTKRIY